MSLKVRSDEQNMSRAPSAVHSPRPSSYIKYDVPIFFNLMSRMCTKPNLINGVLFVLC